MLRHRPHPLWPLGSFVLFLVALSCVNRVEPVILGLPFLSLWLLGATVRASPRRVVGHRTVQASPDARGCDGNRPPAVAGGTALGAYRECPDCGVPVPPADVETLPGAGLDPDPRDPVRRALLRPRRLLQPLETDRV
ncbi:hypothetical protein [Streptomyces scopuliridis]|uniref:hypothetical protein n=1 Tax=Streptomyces scopuliridis TaxID=452529 RepID=UPI0036AEFB9E